MGIRFAIYLRRMGGSPKKIHLLTRSYLAGWAEEGWLRPTHKQRGRQKPRTPAAVGWHREWWGTGEPELNAMCEQICNQLENSVPEMLRRLPEEWPPGPDLRALFAQFLALHVVRTNGFKDWLIPRQEASLAKYRDDFDDRAQYEQFCAAMRSQQHRAMLAFGLVNKVASTIGSMHWTLLAFQEPLLLTSDQPVAAVPLMQEGQEAAIHALPDTGWADTYEIRFPISPRLALLATWHGPLTNGPIVEATWDYAVNLNVSISAQAAEWTYAVRSRPPAMPPLIVKEPPTGIALMARSLFPEYDMRAARESTLRKTVLDEVNRLIDSSDDKRMVIITPQAA